MIDPKGILRTIAGGTIVLGDLGNDAAKILAAVLLISGAIKMYKTGMFTKLNQIER